MYILPFQKWHNKIPVGRLEGIAPQLFGRGGDRPHRPHGVGAYDHPCIAPLSDASILSPSFARRRQRHTIEQQTDVKSVAAHLTIAIFDFGLPFDHRMTPGNFMMIGLCLTVQEC